VSGTTSRGGEGPGTSGLIWVRGMSAEEAEAGDSSDTEAEEADERDDAKRAQEHGGEQKEGCGGGAEDGGDQAEDDFDDGQWGLGARAG